MDGIQKAVNEYTARTGVTKEALAEKLGIGRTSLFLKLRGTSEFSLSEAHKLAKELGISLDDLCDLIASKGVA